MRKFMIFAIAAALSLALTSAPVAAQGTDMQGINILGPGRGWKLQSQHGPDGQNVYGYNCAADFGRISRHRASYMTGHARRTGR
jgi:hypothetical protein